MTIAQIKEAIFEGLTPAAREWWDGSCDEAINAYVIVAQRHGVGAAVNEFNDAYTE